MQDEENAECNDGMKVYEYEMLDELNDSFLEKQIQLEPQLVSTQSDDGSFAAKIELNKGTRKESDINIWRRPKRGALKSKNSTKQNCEAADVVETTEAERKLELHNLRVDLLKKELEIKNVSLRDKKLDCELKQLEIQFKKLEINEKFNKMK